MGGDSIEEESSSQFLQFHESSGGFHNTIMISKIVVGFGYLRLSKIYPPRQTSNIFYKKLFL